MPIKKISAATEQFKKMPGPLTIDVIDFNLLHMRRGALKTLRSLTLSKHSGMNCELNKLTQLVKFKIKVKAKVITAKIDKKIVAWALLSRERSGFLFSSRGGFDPKNGILFEVFVSPSHRRNGIGKALLKRARRHAGPHKLCVAQWDHQSSMFYNSSHYKIHTL